MYKSKDVVTMTLGLKNQNSLHLVVCGEGSFPHQKWMVCPMSFNRIKQKSIV